MSNKPRVAKKFDQSNHHDHEELHQLKPYDQVIFAEISEAIQQLNHAKMNMLTRVAVSEWGYKPGMMLEFSPDVATGEVNVIIRDEVKSAVPSNTNDKES